MAKRTKVTRGQINREIERIRNIVREAEKEGYIFHDVIPKNVNVTKSTLQRLRGISREDILKTARRVDVETGEIIRTQAQANADKRNEQRERKRVVRERQKVLKERRKTTKQNRNNLPKLSDIAFDNIYDMYLSKLEEPIDTSVYDTLMNTMKEPVQEFTATRGGRVARRWKLAIEASKEAKSTILSLVQGVIATEGKDALVRRLNDNADRVQELCVFVLYGSEDVKINSACTELASIIMGKALTFDEATDLAEQMEQNEDWQDTEKDWYDI